MKQQDAVKLFEEQQVRTGWDEDKEEWYVSIIDVIEILTQSDRPRKYWSDLKAKLKKEGSELSEEIGQLKIKAPDGKMRLTDVASTEQLFRLIQSIPSPKAEPFKLWLATLAKERLDEMQDPEISIDRALKQYLELGYTENWINQRLKSIEIRKELTDEWKSKGLKEGVEFATLTDIITKTWADKTTKEYKILKGLKKENLRDNMTNTELILNMLAEASTKDIDDYFTAEPAYYHGKCVNEDTYRQYDCSSFDNIIAEYGKGRTMDTDFYSVNFPKPKGISGGGIYRLVDTKDGFDRKLIGIGHTYKDKKHLLIGTNIGFCLDIILKILERENKSK